MCKWDKEYDRNFFSSHYRSSNDMILEYKRRFLFLVYCIFKRKTDVATGFLFAFKKKKKRKNDGL